MKLSFINQQDISYQKSKTSFQIDYSNFIQNLHVLKYLLQPIQI